MTLIPVVASVSLLGCAVLLSLKPRRERLLSLAIGGVVALGFGVQEMLAAVGSNMSDAERTLHAIASVAFTSSAALFVRLAVRSARRRSVPAQT